MATYPLLGPFGAMIGKAMPITPKMAEKIMIGSADAPMVAGETGKIDISASKGSKNCENFATLC